MRHDDPWDRRLFTRESAIAGTFLVLAVVMTWPIGRLWHPALPDLNDAQFNVWRLAWIAHQLHADPAHLFDANIFFPATNTLAYSDAMLLLGVAAAPLVWAGIHPFVVHNLFVVGAFWLASYGGYRLCLRITNAFWPAIVGGVIAGFAPYRFGHIAHLELLWTAFLPVGLLALQRLVERPSIVAGLHLAVWHVLQTLCSVYYGIFFAIYLGVAAIVMLVGQPRTVVVKSAGALAVGALVAAVALWPYIATYRNAARTIAFRSVDEITRFSAVPVDYLRTSRDNTLQPLRTSEFEEERSLYPGALALGLALVGIVAATRATVTYAILLIVSVDLSFGMHGILYPQLLQVFPLLASLRAPARFGAFVIVGLSVMSALGATRVLAWRRVPRWIAPALVAGVILEYWAAPVEVREHPVRPPALYAWLAQQPRGVVLELPVPAPDALWGFETRYAFLSIYHWQPLVNGYSGNAPPSYVSMLETMQQFPSAASIERLRSDRVQWVIIHEGLMSQTIFAEMLERVLASQAFRTLGTFQDGIGRATVLEVLATTM